MNDRNRLIRRTKHMIKLTKWRNWREKYVPKKYWDRTWFYSWMWD